MALGPEDPDPSGTAVTGPIGTLRAVLDAIFKEDNRIGGQAVTRLRDQLDESTTDCMEVVSTIGFGEYTDGEDNARVLVGGEVIDCASRNSAVPFGFETLTRGVGNTEVKTHPAGTLVYDLSRNTSAIDLVRRGVLVNFAVGEDLETIARNLGLERCIGVSQEQLRRIIKAVAYLPKQTNEAFRQALLALTDDATAFTITERLASDPYKVFVEIDPGIATDIRGRFLLNGGEPQLTTGLTTVDTDYAINQVLGVYLDTPLTRMGIRDGFTNFATTNTFVGSTITLDVSPGAAGTAVLVDYGAFDAHMLAADETVRQDIDNADHWAYLADPLLAARCLLDQIRAAGVRVELSTKL